MHDLRTPYKGLQRATKGEQGRAGSWDLVGRALIKLRRARHTGTWPAGPTGYRSGFDKRYNGDKARPAGARQEETGGDRLGRVVSAKQTVRRAKGLMGVADVCAEDPKPAEDVWRRSTEMTRSHCSGSGLDPNLSIPERSLSEIRSCLRYCMSYACPRPMTACSSQGIVEVVPEAESCKSVTASCHLDCTLHRLSARSGWL